MVKKPIDVCFFQNCKQKATICLYLPSAQACTRTTVSKNIKKHQRF